MANGTCGKASAAPRTQAVLDARVKFPGSTMAALYDPLTMPKDLVDANRAIDDAYGTRPFQKRTRTPRILFDLYRKYTEPLGLVEQKKAIRQSRGLVTR